MRLIVFHHYLYPDPNVSSVHLSELCAGLAARGWQVTAYSSNRNIEDPSVSYPRAQVWNGVRIKRMWRPALGRGSGAGRILNAAWMIFRWSLLVFRESPDAIIIGTDPILSVLLARVWRIARPRTVIVQWVFDLYPEVAVADGVLKEDAAGTRAIRALLKPSYAACDVIADIGPCMRTHLRKYHHHSREVTLVPWAMTEPGLPLPISADERAQVFGPTTLALMYSGTFGRAHSYDDMLELMQHLEGSSAHLAFSIKGQREQALRAASLSRTNISFVPFASKERLNDRLAAPDIHVVSLRDAWTGMVIPSKFFGAIAVGRPVLFCGSPDSSIAVWIRQYGLGWVLEPGKAREVAIELRQLIEDPAALEATRARCHQVYQRSFSRETTLTQWDVELRAAHEKLEPTKSRSQREVNSSV